MKKLWIVVLLVLSLGTVCLASDKVEAPEACVQCGMDRTKFGHSRMVVTYSDGSNAGTCSLNCVVTDLLKSKGKTAKSFQVADYNTRKLIDAKTAFWVIGGSKKGVMTAVAKWAFTTKSAAQSFVDSNGGTITDWETALLAAH